jgi:hypothetical protein
MDTTRIRPVTRPSRPAWQSALLWLAGGMALTWLAAFFLDGRRGAARRQMAVDRTMAQARDLAQWSGKKARHMRNKAQGTMAEMQSREVSG